MSSRLNRSFLQIAGPTAIVALALTAAPAAQQQQAKQPDQQQAKAQQAQPLLTSSQVDDEMLEQFTRAYLEVVPIQQKMKQDLAATTDQAKMKQIRYDANKKMVETLKSHDLTIKQFNRLLKSVNKDPKLSKRFIAEEEKVQKS